MSCDHGDKMFIGPEVLGTDGARLSVRHKADHTNEYALTRPLREGENIAGARVVFGRTEGNVMHITDELDLRGGAATATGSGPPQVATEEYRDGWDRIFGARKVAQA